MNLTLHLTHNCNLRCRYCYAGEKRRCDMTPEVMRKAIDLALSETKGAFTVSFFGGEPLLKRELMREGLEYANGRAKETGNTVGFQISTNGTLINDSFLDLAEKWGIALSISVDGIREAHDAHRVFPDGSGSFDVIDRKLPGILERLPYTAIMLVVTPETAKYLPQSADYFLDKGVRFVVSTPNYAADWDVGSLKTLEKSYRKLARSYIKRVGRSQKFFLSVLDNKIATHTRGPCSEREKCSAGKSDISVAPSGRIYPCVQFVKDDSDDSHVIGDVFNGFNETRRAEIFEESRRQKQHCPDCAINDRCNNWCACLNWQTTGSMNQVSPVLCAHERMLVRVADEVGEKLYARRNKHFIHKHYNEAYPVLSFVEDELAKTASKQERTG